MPRLICFGSVVALALTALLGMEKFPPAGVGIPEGVHSGGRLGVADPEEDFLRAPDPADAELMSDFLNHSAEVVEGVAFVQSPNGFIAQTSEEASPAGTAGDAEPSGRRSLQLQLPARGEGAARLSFPLGLAVSVFERGVHGPGRKVRGAVAYSRTGGTSYWRTTDNGYEEWLLLADAHEGPVAEWEVQGGQLWQDGESVLVTDASGRPKLRVTAPRAYGSDGREARVWLRAVGNVLALYTTARGRALLDPLWTEVGSLTTARFRHSATLLASGKVLVAGGCCEATTNNFLRSAELFDPATGAWSATASLTIDRYYYPPAALLLASGKVLVAGGGNYNGPLPDAELYDPATETWNVTGSLATARYAHTATLLVNGQVLIAGGCCDATGNLRSAELYDPAKGTWSATGSLTTGRSYHTATLLSSGEVLIAGGSDNGGYLSSAELYDPATGTWSATGSMTMARYDHTATLLALGEVLVAGGFDASAELYDPNRKTWSATGPMATARYSHTATLLSSGNVLVAGGANSGTALASAEVFHPTTGTWSATAFMATVRSNHTATFLPSSGKVLVAGGADNVGLLDSTEVYEPELVISPANPAVAPRASETFTASGGTGLGYTWSFFTNASGGTLTASGDYIAGGTGGVTDVVRVTDSLGESATVPVTVTAPLTISPSGVTTVASRSSQQFTASGGGGSGYTWSLVTNASGGSLSQAGQYTAGTTASVADIVGVTDSLGNSATSTVVVTPPIVKSGGCAAAGGNAVPLVALAVLPLLTLRRARQTPARTPRVRGIRLASVVALTVASAGGIWRLQQRSPSLRSEAPESAVNAHPDGHRRELRVPTTPAVGFTLEEAEAALMNDFPLQAAEVVVGTGFVRSAGGFIARGSGANAPAGAVEAAEASLAARAGLQLVLPSRGDAPVTFAIPGGLVLEVRELGASGPGREVQGAVAYARAGGASYWRNTDTGYEEWLLLADVRESRVAGWDVQGGYLRQDGDGVLVTDAAGQARVRVTAPTAYGAGAQRARAWLRAEGNVVALYTTARGRSLVDPVWTPVGSMRTARHLHTATLLPSGKVLVAGGADDASAVASAELYDAATATWSPTGSMSTARLLHTATLLPSGKVLVVGGGGTGNPLGSAELYDPATGTWSPTGSLGTARTYFTATLLASGKVLVSAGFGAGKYLDSAELYDPATGVWTVTGSLAAARYSHTATLLPSGEVLVASGAGGTIGDVLTSAERYDPVAGTWSGTGSLTTGRLYYAATLLPSGQVLVAGGLNSSSPVTSAELYNPSAGTWSATGSLTYGRLDHTATLLPSGKVLVAGGYDVAELYDPSTGSWSPDATLLPSRAQHTATLLPSGKVLVAGGYGAGALSSAELYDAAGWPSVVVSPSSATLATGASQTFSASGGSGTGYTWSFVTNASGATLSASGVYTAGATGGVADVFRVNDSVGNAATVTVTVTSSWTTVGSMLVARNLHTATLLLSGKVLVVGGSGGYSALSSAELFDPATTSWSATGPMASARQFHTATLLPSGKVLVAGGCCSSSGSSLDTAELYDPSTGTWSGTSTMVSLHNSHTATLLPSGLVLVAGGYDGTNAELYDPVMANWVATGPMVSVHGAATATLLPSGKVLVAAGNDNSGGRVARAELYDPATGTWDATDPLEAARVGHTATLLPSGKVLVSGGNDTTAERYDPVTGKWSTIAPMETARSGNTATLLASGKVLVAGGSLFLPSVEVYEPTSGTWNATGPMATARVGHTATLLVSGKVLLAGGYDGNERVDLAKAEVYSSVAISPLSVTVAPRTSQSFTASGGSGFGYTWSFVTDASGGSLSATGVYTAGGTGGVTDVVRVTDSLGESVFANVVVTAALAISPGGVTTLAPKDSQTFTASGGSGSGYVWSLLANASDGTLSATGVYTAGAVGGVVDVVGVTDSLGSSATSTVIVTALPSPKGGCAAPGGELMPLLALAVLPLFGSLKRRR
jgi:hypothetical protein